MKRDNLARLGAPTQMRGWRDRFIMAFAMVSACVLAHAQVPTGGLTFEGERVAFVDIIASPGIDTEKLRPLLDQLPGTEYSEQRVQSTVEKLRQDPNCTDVHVTATPDPSGLHIDFLCEPVYYLGMMTFPGAVKKFDYPRLVQVASYPPEHPFEGRALHDAQSAVVRFFGRSGYFLASSETELEVDDTHRLVNPVFHVTLGDRADFGEIIVQGPPELEAARIENLVQSWKAWFKGARVKPGKNYNPDRLTKAVNLIRDDLSDRDYLANQVRLDFPLYDPESNRASITFHVTLGPVIKVRTAGADVSRGTLRRLVPVFEEHTFDDDLVAEGQRNLVSYFQSKGYFNATVTSTLDDSGDDVSLIYQIDRGEKYKVSDVHIRGNNNYTDQELERFVTVKAGGWFRRGQFDNDRLRRSADALAGFYRSIGYLDVAVEPRVETNGRRIEIFFNIVEGQRTLVNALNVRGNSAFPVEDLTPNGLNLRPGRPYSQELLQQDRDQVVAKYLDSGFLNTTFRTTVEPVAGDPHRVNVTYLIQEGPKIDISNVIKVGAQHTKTAFVDTVTGLDAGQPLSEGKLLESESRLYNAGVFDWVDVSPKRLLNDQRQEEVLIRLHESSRNYLEYGFGFEMSGRTANIPAGTVALPGLPSIGLPTEVKTTQRQFASPRGSLQYIRRNIRGKAETATLALLAARLDQRASLSYANPYWRFISWTSLVTLAWERSSENPLYTSRLNEATWQLEHPLNAAGNQRLFLRYTFRRTALSNLLIPELVLESDRTVRLSTFSASYLRDTRDVPLDAKRGVYQSVDIGINPKLLSSAQFGRFLGQSAYYKEIGGGVVWASQGRLGVAKPFSDEVPISERFFSGGASSLRGFPVNGAGPQRNVPVCASADDPSSCATISVPVGGDMLFIVNSELRFPMPLPLPLLDKLGGVVFYDGGNVYNAVSFRKLLSDYTNTVGFGLRYNTPVGPVRFDVGHNLNPVNGIKTTQFFVTLGQSF